MANLQGYLNELERFRASDQARDRLVNVSTYYTHPPQAIPSSHENDLTCTQELLEKFKTLSGDYENLKSDYHSERDGRRNYQRLVEEQKQESLELASQIVSRFTEMRAAYLCNISLCI